MPNYFGCQHAPYIPSPKERGLTARKITCSSYLEKFLKLFFSLRKRGATLSDFPCSNLCGGHSLLNLIP